MIDTTIQWGNTIIVRKIEKRIAGVQMKKVLFACSRVFRWLAVGSFWLFVACPMYGIAQPFKILSLSLEDEGGNKITGLKVSGSKGVKRSQYTADPTECSIDVPIEICQPESVKVQFFVEDLDGSANGGYYGSTYHSVEFTDAELQNPGIGYPSETGVQKKIVLKKIGK